MDEDLLISSVLLMFAILVWFILSMSETRTRKLKGACNGRPGIVFPINFLNPRHHLVYALACAAQASLWLELLTSSLTTSTGGNKWIGFLFKALILVLLSVVVVLLTFPMLACVEAPIPILGYTLGLIYSTLYLVGTLTRIFIQLEHLSSNADQSFKAYVYGTTLGQLFPEMLSLIGVLVWYSYKLFKETRRIILCGQYWKKAMMEQPPSTNHVDYVKRIFSNNGKVTSSGRLSYYYSRVYAYIPLPLMIASAVSAVVVFQLMLFTVVTFPYLTQILATNVRFLREQLQNNNISSAFTSISEILDGLTAVFVIASLLSTILSVVLFAHLLYSVRKEILLMRIGKSKLCADVKVIKWSALKLTSSIRYCGFQIASVITGWIFYSIIFFLIGLFFVAVHFLPEVFGYLLYLIFIAGVMVIIPLTIQGLMCKFIFLSPESSIENTIIINNRRAYNSFTYFVLLYNVATGLYTSIVRLLVAFLLTILLKPRLDRIIFLSPFRLYDSGYGMYKSFMITEALLHNPVVHTFVQLISENKNDRMKDIKLNKPGYRFSQRARNRWFVAITLINNKSLRKCKCSDEDLVDNNNDLD